MTLTRAAFVVLALAIVAEVMLVTGSALGLVLLAIAIWFAAPGVYFVRRSVAVAPEVAGTAWLIGPALGLGVSVFGLLVLRAIGLQNWLALVAAPGLTLGLGVLAARVGGPRLRLPVVDRGDGLPLAAALLLVPLITWAPYGNVRAPLPEGEAYRAYFTADFIWAMAVTSELAKGDLPPDNPFRHGEPMRYYWMSHMLSGTVYRNVQALGIGTEPVVLVNGLAFGLAFVAFMYWLARSVGASPWWAWAGVFAGFAANSYEGTDMLRSILQRGESWELIRDTNIDAVTRWFYQGMAIDGLHRLLLYQPHHLTGYVLSLTALWLVASADDVSAISVSVWAGVLLGMGLLFSTFGAIIVTAATALVYAIRLLQQGRLKSLLQAAILTGGPLLIGVLLTRRLGYTNAADGLLMTFGLNPVALRNLPWVFFLSFGPLLLLGLPAMLRPRWALTHGLAPAALTLTAFVIYLVVDVPDMGGVWVGWRSGHMLLVTFGVAAAAGLTALWRYAESKAAVAVVVVVAAALAIPTVALDVYNAQDIHNRQFGAGFPWTLIITPQEREALDWIRTQTPPTAIVQPEVFVRDPATWAYVPAFAERRMAAGIPISMVPLFRYQETASNVQWGIFRSSSAEDAHGWANFLKVDYVLVGAPEREKYGAQIERLRQRPDLFETAFANEALLVLRVVKGDAAGRRQ